MLVFNGSMSFVDFPVNSGFANNPMTHFARTHYSIIPWPRPGFYMGPLIILMSRQGGPLFQHSNCERSELSSMNLG